MRRLAEENRDAGAGFDLREIYGIIMGLPLKALRENARSDATLAMPSASK